MTIEERFVRVCAPKGRVAHLIDPSGWTTRRRALARGGNWWPPKRVKTLCGKTFVGNDAGLMRACAICYERARLIRIQEREATWAESIPPPSVRRAEPPPPFVSDEVLKIAGGLLDRHAIALVGVEKRLPRTTHYQFNQLAHWLWRMAGAEAPAK